MITSVGVSLFGGGIVERFLWKKFLFDWGLTRVIFAVTFSGHTGAIFFFDGLEPLLKPENFFFLKPLCYASMLVLSKGTFDFVSY